MEHLTKETFLEKVFNFEKIATGNMKENFLV